MTQFLENFGFYKEKIPQDLYNDLLKEWLIEIGFNLLPSKSTAFIKPFAKI